MITRRSFIATILAAPAIVRASSLMPVKAWRESEWRHSISPIVLGGAGTTALCAADFGFGGVGNALISTDFEMSVGSLLFMAGSQYKILTSDEFYK